jgi:hypothetical protein
MSDERMDKQQLLESLQYMIEEDWQPDHDGEWIYDRRPEEWPPEFKAQHFETIRILRAVELLPMNLSAEITEEGEFVLRFSPEFDQQQDTE